MSLFEEAKQFLRDRAYAYRAVFANPVGDEVLKDLARFCRAHDSTFHADPRIAAQLDGRREVWLHIQRHLHLTDEQLWQLLK